MKLLRVVNSVDAAAGGAIEAARRLSEVSVSNGDTVEFCSVDGPDAASVKDFPFKLHPLGPPLGKYGFTRRLVPWLRQNAMRYDAVVIDGIWQYHSLAVWFTLRKSGPPYCVYLHGMLDPWFKHQYPLKHLKKCLYWSWGEYRVLRDAAAVLFTCEEERVRARQSFSLYKANEIVVNLGAAAPPQDPATQTAAFFESFPHLRRKRLVLFMGRLHPKKSCDLIIQAFASVLAGDPDWHLVFAGPDQIGWRAELERLAHRLGFSNRVTFTGMISGGPKWGAYRASEVLLLPSHQENFAIVVAEALACGVPVLISDKVNIWREVQSDGAGIVASDDVNGAASLLRAWKTMPDEEKSHMRLCARASFEKRFEIQEASEHLQRALNRIVFERAASSYARAELISQ